MDGGQSGALEGRCLVARVFLLLLEFMFSGYHDISNVDLTGLYGLKDLIQHRDSCRQVQVLDVT